MNIHNNGISQGLQNAVFPAGKNSTAVNERAVSAGGSARTNTEIRQESTAGQSSTISSLISNLEDELNDDPNVVLYPPFFPIAKYQRLNLIEKVQGLSNMIQNSSLDADTKSSFSPSSLDADSTDEEMSAAIGNLLSFRDQLKESGQVSLEGLKPGSFVNIEI